MINDFFNKAFREKLRHLENDADSTFDSSFLDITLTFLWQNLKETLWKDQNSKILSIRTEVIQIGANIKIEQSYKKAILQELKHQGNTWKQKVFAFLKNHDDWKGNLNSN